MTAAGTQLSEAHRKELARARKLLEKDNLATRLADFAGKPLQSVLERAPLAVRRKVDAAIQRAIVESLNLAIRSLKDAPKRAPRQRLASVWAGVAGGFGGVFGAAALPVELPLTTVLMLRAIADIARHHGEDLSTIEGRLACVEVFAHGSARSRDAAGRRADVGYYASRAMLGRLANEASAFLMERGASRLAAPAVAALTAEVASRFGVVVWEKIAVSAVPLAGALGAATINVVFMNHFQSIARGHFMLRRLERIYGEEAIRAYYSRLSAADD